MSSHLHKIEGEFGANEDWLQRYIGSHPEVLPTRDLEGMETPLRLIAREAGNIDLLFADKRGLLTVVETKLYKNPELRREVIAQVLEYASNLRDFSVPELCKLIASTKDSQALQPLPALRDFVRYLSERVPESGKGEDRAKATLAHYVISGKLNDSPSLSAEEKRFLERLNTMLEDESFRLMIVTEKAPPEFLELLNYTSSITRRGTQVVGVELSLEGIGNDRYFVPHLVGTHSRLSAEYYRSEGTAARLTFEWDMEKYLEQTPPQFRADLSMLAAELKKHQDHLSMSFGRGRKGALIVGAFVGGSNRRNNLLEIKTNGKVRVYGSTAGAGLTSTQKETLVMELEKRPYLSKVAREIREGYKTKRYGSEPEVDLAAFGSSGALVSNIVDLLEDYYHLASS